MSTSSLVAEVPATESLLRRYAPLLRASGLPAPSDATLAACSLGEGARLVPAGDYRGVELVVCDETTGMATGTYKDLDACLTIALAKERGLERLVVSSGGNLGHALARYAAHAGIAVIVLQPRTTSYKLDADVYAHPLVSLVSVDRPEPEVKALTRALAARYALPHVPDLAWRFAASAARAAFLHEHALTIGGGGAAGALAQTMCGGYGPIGIYRCFAWLAERGLVAHAAVPRFLGFQQDANAPMASAWRSGSRTITAQHVHAEPERYLEPGLYNTNPGESYTELFELMQRFGGDMLGVDAADYDRYAPAVIARLASVGITLTRRADDAGEMLEKTGVLTGVGILKAIDAGLVRPGERVVHLLTGGCRRPSRAAGRDAPRGDVTGLAATARVEPRVVVDGTRSLEAWLPILGERLGLERPAPAWSAAWAQASPPPDRAR